MFRLFSGYDGDLVFTKRDSGYKFEKIGDADLKLQIPSYKYMLHECEPLALESNGKVHPP